MEIRSGYDWWHPGDFLSQCQIAVFLFLVVIITILAIYGGLSQGAIMSLLGFVPLLMSGMKNKKKERHRMSFIKKIKSSVEKFGMQASVDDTAVCIRDFTVTTAKEQRRKKISYSRVFSLFRSKPAPSKDIFTISGDICDMDDLEDGKSADRKEKKSGKEKGKDPFSSLDQILLSLLKVGMMRKV